MRSPNENFNDDAIPVKVKRKTPETTVQPIRTGRAAPQKTSAAQPQKTPQKIVITRAQTPAVRQTAAKPKTVKPAGSTVTNKPRTTAPAPKTAVKQSAPRPATTETVRKPSQETAGKREALKTQNKKKGLGVGRIIGRCAIVLLTVILVLVYAVYVTGYTLANGPSETLRDQLVMMALQASATKWAPGLFLSDEEVNAIYERSQEVHEEKIIIPPDDPDDPDHPDDPKKDEWADAVDGVLYKEVRKNGFKAYMVLIRDPSRVFTGVGSSDFATATEGLRIWDAAKKFDALIAINGGEFHDPGGTGSGAQPVGLTYSKGICVWNDGHTNNTFIGFDKDNRLVVSNGMTKARADELGIRDGVMFQKKNLLISNDGVTVTTYRRDGDAGTAQRTAIGQRADGTVILVVTDGRTASSIGATYNDIIELMLSEGAITAGMLDGGSSSLLYYKDYFTVHGIDESTLDQYQKKGIVNKYKAFTTPRRLPTFFMVSKGGAAS